MSVALSPTRNPQAQCVSHAFAVHAPAVVPEDPVVLSPAMVEAFRLINCYAPAETPVVLVGETGTGKSYLAELLHRCSGRAGRFEDVSAGELDDELASDRLFGHARGAFTGALGKRVGAFLEAGAGTLLFDDFHLLRRSTQYLLLRTLERRTFKPVGVDRDVPVACRLVFGIGAEPDRLVAERRLLPDLRYRLGHCVVRIPRLAERREEIALLAQRFLVEAQADTRLADGPTVVSKSALGVLERAPWPGNVRDLREVVVTSYLHGRSRASRQVEVTDLPAELLEAGGNGRFNRRADAHEKRRLVDWAMWRSGGKIAQAARLIGIHRNTLSAVRRGKDRERVPATQRRA